MTDTELKSTLSLLHCADDRELLSSMTDEEWQKKFEILKLMNNPTKENRLSRKCGSIRVMNRHWSLSNGDTGGNETLDSYYVVFTNDILKCIRGKCGKKELIQNCRHIYQICELLRFEPELKTKLIHDGGNTYFDVWLDKDNKG